MNVGLLGESLTHATVIQAMLGADDNSRLRL